MKRRIFLLALMMGVCAISIAESTETVVRDFIALVKSGNAEKMADKVIYPFNSGDAKYLQNKSEFIRLYRTIFDSTMVRTILQSNPSKDWTDMGWRGIRLLDGEIWLDSDGMLLSVNHVVERLPKPLLSNNTANTTQSAQSKKTANNQNKSTQTNAQKEKDEKAKAEEKARKEQELAAAKAKAEQEKKELEEKKAAEKAAKELAEKNKREAEQKAKEEQERKALAERKAKERALVAYVEKTKREQEQKAKAEAAAKAKADQEKAKELAYRDSLALAQKMEQERQRAMEQKTTPPQSRAHSSFASAW